MPSGAVWIEEALKEKRDGVSDFLGKVLAITALAGVGCTGLGGWISCLFRRDSGRTVSLLLSFAAGIMIAVVCFDLLGDALRQPSAGIRSVIPGVLAGFGAVWLLNARISGGRAENVRCPADGELFWAGVVMAAAIALHNLPEGMVIGASFAAGAGDALLSRSGWITAGVIGFHNIPEGMAVAVPLIAGGMPKPRAVALTASTGLPTVLGAWAGVLLGTLSPLALALSLSFASGAMLYVVFGELLPESALLWRSRLPALAAILGMLAGVWILSC